MKNNRITLTIALFFLILFSNNSFSQEIPCSSVSSGSTKSLLETSILFNSMGINLSKYDWSDANLNCHINSTMKYYKKSRKNLQIGLSFLTTGALIMTYVGIKDGSETVIKFGGILVAISIPILLSTKGSMKKSNKHLKEVGKYYRDKQWF